MSIQPNENLNNDNYQDELQNPNPTLDTQSIPLTANSNALLVPVRRVEEQNKELSIEQDPKHLIQGFSTLSTTNTTITQPQLQLTTSRNFDIPPPPEYDTSTSSSISQQPSSAHTKINGLITNTRPQFTFKSPTPGRPSVSTHPYTPAQNTTDTNIPSTFNLNMIHINPPPNIVSSRTTKTKNSHQSITM